jgi:nitrite reductase (NO-forming)
MENTKKFALIRIAFGVVWAVDAFFKWQPDFFTNFISYLTSGAEGQPAIVQGWINLWVNMMGVNPHLFAIFVALAETALAVGLIFGIFTRLTCYAGIAFSLVLWSTAEGFGGPYTAGSTDVGSAIIYALVFVALLAGQSWKTWSVDALRAKN